MKKNLFVWMAIIIAGAGMLVTSCDGNEEEVIPVVYIIKGPTTVFQSAVEDYEILVPWEQPGTTWSWAVTGATLQDVSSDTRTATVSFQTMPANDTVYITVIETTAAGLVSPEKVIKVKINPFCALDINNFVGPYDCDEAGYGVYAVNFTKDAVLANTIINDNFWDWAGPGAILKYTFSGDFLEKVTVPKQDFEYGDGYVGWVQGSGTYNGCSHTMIVDYIVYYDGDEYDIHHEFAPAKKGSTYTVVQKRSAGNIK